MPDKENNLSRQNTVLLSNIFSRTTFRNTPKANNTDFSQK